MKRDLLATITVPLVFCCFTGLCFAQLGLFSKEQRIAFTRDWQGERFSDGRPKVPDGVLEGLREVSAEEAWSVLQQAGYSNQFEGGWKTLNAGPRLVGRVVTAVFMPFRPDVGAVVEEKGKAEGRIGAQNSWIIDILQPEDVLVVDVFGKVKDGPIIGDNLGVSIFTKTHTGIIVNGSVRDKTGLKGIEGFQVFTRAFNPSAIRNVMLMGIDVPVRIGETTIMPGDVAVSDPEGITFIPPQLCARVADEAALTHLIDEWGHMMLREGKYTPGQIDGKWPPSMIEEFNKWVGEVKHSKLRLKVEK